MSFAPDAGGAFSDVQAQLSDGTMLALVAVGTAAHGAAVTGLPRMAPAFR